MFPLWILSGVKDDRGGGDDWGYERALGPPEASLLF